MNNLMTIQNVRGYIDSNGTAHLNLEDISRGLGFTTIAASGNEVVRWNTVYQYLSGFGVATSCNGPDYRSMCPEFIPENIFYRLAMKAKNETAEKFQALVADEILPSIRKHGMYAKDELLDNPDLMIEVLQELKKEREEKKLLTVEIAQQKQIIGELKPRADYTDTILKNKGLVTITQIAKDYGMSGQEMNTLLHENGVQYKQSEQWLLYTKYQDKGYTHSETINIVRKDGRPDITMNTKWTQKGRLFIYGLLKKSGILPVIEREDQAS